MIKFKPSLEALDHRAAPSTLYDTGFVSAISTVGYDASLLYVGDGPQLIPVDLPPANNAPAQPAVLPTWNINVTPSRCNSDDVGNPDIASDPTKPGSGKQTLKVEFTIYQCTNNQPGQLTYDPQTGQPTNGTFTHTVDITAVAGQNGFDLNQLATDAANAFTQAGVASGVTNGVLVHVNGPMATTVMIGGQPTTVHGIVKSVSVVVTSATDVNANPLGGLGNYAWTVQQAP